MSHDPVLLALKRRLQEGRSRMPSQSSEDAYAQQGPVSEWDEGDHPWRVLRDLAHDGGYLAPHDVAAWLEARGGSEHLCRHLPDPGRWEKVTMANSAGWWVDLAIKRCLPATPLPYFERMAAVNEVFGDDTRLVGVDTGPGPPRHTHPDDSAPDRG